MTRQTEVETPWYTRKEAAEYLRISMRQLDYLAGTGLVVRHTFTNSPTVRYHIDDLDALLKESRRVANAVDDTDGDTKTAGQ